ncbi:MAG: 23S rRNA (pseudouridine(1915)-N(3))-methyltransferase RlmH [Clostridia bacterium]|nr:23S rRNA (pseudouridine(1915)-N(3))-methyltransferase RlmH [Clostridia bacterium]
MVKIKIVATGSGKEKELTKSVEDFTKRLSAWANVSVVYVPEFAPKNNGEIENSKKKESILQLKSFEGFTICLDRRGEMLSSEEFAKKIDNIMLSSSTITFVIGGSCGFSKEVLDKANFVMSFGKITFPHEIMKLVLIEQIYRAFSINNNLPYHK